MKLGDKSLFPLLSKEGCPADAGWGGFRRFGKGFTLIELLVVMAIIATLLTLVIPRYFGSVDRSKEVVLKQSLVTVRDAIDKYYGDTGRYPESLQVLVDKRYIRSLPVDPVTESAETWALVPPADAAKGGVYDLHSGAPGTTRDGTPFAEL
jgi:general secretion pathway protein G